MTAGWFWPLVTAAALVVLAAVLATVEAALMHISRVRVEEFLRDGRRGAEALQDIEADPARYLNVVAFLRVAGEVLAVVLVAQICLEYVRPRSSALALAAVVMVVVSYIVVGVSPRTLGRQHADSVGILAAGAVRAFARVLGPLTKLLILLGNAVTPGKGYADGPFASEAELRDLVDLAQENRVIEAGERRMIHSVFELGDTIVREIMVPRTDMVFIERDKSLRQAVSLALRSGFSRIPVVGDGLDDVIGVIYLKDLVLRTYDDAAAAGQRVDAAMRAPTFVPESKPVDDVLREMQAQRNHIAIVVDEYGGTAGLVTIEDVIEEIVGDIADEYDLELPEVQHLDGGGLRVSTRLNLTTLSELLDAQLEDDDVDTVGGLLAKHLGRVPLPGARIVVDGIVLVAEGALGRRNRVATAMVSRTSDQPHDDDVTAEAAHNALVANRRDEVEHA